ncbi:MAG: CopG family transcriptional regulator [Deltaproteobacteria bacterium]|nr:MAG: CopG family transcriptional regulator [Deltaproteobacteria bacterium]RLC19004.1 MAG: CopG family transcriptional regulator [Deltaproteobacteria bacterium]
MAASKIAITIDDRMLKQLDILVKSNFFPNRSKAIQEAISEKLLRLEKSRLVQECAKLDPNFEQTMAEEGLSTEMEEWPEY